MRKLIPLFLFCFVATALTVLEAAEKNAPWKIVEGKIVSKFASDLDPKNPLPEYPRPQMERKVWQNLNGLWDYAIVDRAQTSVAQYDGQILVPYAVESALSGVGKQVGKDKRLWYKRSFTIPNNTQWKGKRIMLHFGAVDWQTTVYVNGKEVGQHTGGYTPFSFDITDALKPQGNQELVLAVWDPTTDGYQPIGKQHNNPHGIWYTPVTGIWQTVWLEPVGTTSIESLKMTPNIKNNTLYLETKVRGIQKGDRVEAQVTYVTTGPRDMPTNQGPFGKKGSRVVTHTRVTTIATKQVSAGAPMTISIPNAKLWTPDNPELYNLKVSVIRQTKNGNKIQFNYVDRVDSYFGMREISLGKCERGFTRMMLNGKFVFQHGPLDQGWWPDGLYTAPTDAALKYDIVITKQLGYNMLRKHVKVEPARFYYHCDKLGMLVWQDMPSGDPKAYISPSDPDAERSPEAKANFERELADMIEAFYNSPSIVVWVPFNEGWGQYETCRILDLAKKLDPTRLIDGPSGWSDRGCGDMYDMHKYRGPGMFPPEEKRATVLGEYGGLGLPVPGHTWLQSDKNWGYGGNLKDKDDLLKTYMELNKRMHPLIGKGLSAAVYTQTTDVEIEVNGLMTYDRELKVDLDKFCASNEKLRYAPPEEKTLIANATEAETEWAYTFDAPAENWAAADFNDSEWKKGPAAFGQMNMKRTTPRTEWTTNDIWLRKSFEVTEDDIKDLSQMAFNIYHDEDAEIYINGVKIISVTGHNGSYEAVDMPANEAFKPGTNVIAVHCKQTGGGQLIDLDLKRFIPAEDSSKKVW